MAKKTQTKLPKPATKVFFYDADQYLGNAGFSGSGGGIDDLDKMKQRDLKDKISRIRTMEADVYLKKKEDELKKLERGVSSEKTGSLESMTPTMATELAKLDDETRQRTLETYIMFKGAEKGATGGGGMLLPMLIGFARSNPGSDKNSMVEFAKVMTDQMKTGIDLAKGVRGGEGNWNPVQLINTFASFVKDNMKSPWEELVKKLQPQPSAFEEILMNDKLFERAKGLGMFGGTGEGKMSDATALEIEKLRGERSMQVERLRTDREQWRANFQKDLAADARKWAFAERMMSGPIGGLVSKLGGAAVSKISGGKPGEIEQSNMPEAVIYQCLACGGTFPGSSDAKIVTCPHCRKELHIGSPPTEQQREQQTEKTGLDRVPDVSGKRGGGGGLTGVWT